MYQLRNYSSPHATFQTFCHIQAQVGTRRRTLTLACDNSHIAKIEHIAEASTAWDAYAMYVHSHTNRQINTHTLVQQTGRKWLLLENRNIYQDMWFAQCKFNNRTLWRWSRNAIARRRFKTWYHALAQRQGSWHQVGMIPTRSTELPWLPPAATIFGGAPLHII